MSKYQIERGRDGEDFVLVAGEPIGVISRGAHGRVTTCTIEGRRTHGGNGECRPGAQPGWLVKRAHAVGLIGTSSRQLAGKLSPAEKTKILAKMKKLQARRDKLVEDQRAKMVPLMRGDITMDEWKKIKAAFEAEDEALDDALNVLDWQQRGSKPPKDVMARVKPELLRGTVLGSIITGDEERRLDALTARHTAILARLEGDQLDQLLGADVKRRGQSDEVYRARALNNVHPDDLEAAISARGLGGCRHARRVAPTTSGDQAYRGYLIRVHPTSGDISIARDGFHIGYAKDVDTAKRTIDELVG